MNNSLAREALDHWRLLVARELSPICCSHAVGPAHGKRAIAKLQIHGTMTSTTELGRLFRRRESSPSPMPRANFRVRGRRSNGSLSAQHCRPPPPSDLPATSVWCVCACLYARCTGSAWASSPPYAGYVGQSVPLVRLSVCMCMECVFLQWQHFHAVLCN